MRFYRRHEIMPGGGFADLVGEERFTPPKPGEGRYVTDAAMTEVILDLAAEAGQPSLIYAVTIENHGPWAPDARGGGAPDLVESYLHLARHSDAMLSALTQGLAALGRPALLVFFGDHRPSIPGASVPGGARHTPYVMVRMDGDGRVVPGDSHRVDLTPAQLHHAVLDTILGTPMAT
jgi:phosphoglycerol transferase MdoB-like AlkP superfamily enzyme